MGSGDLVLYMCIGGILVWDGILLAVIAGGHWKLKLHPNPPIGMYTSLRSLSRPRGGAMRNAFVP